MLTHVLAVGNDFVWEQLPLKPILNGNVNSYVNLKQTLDGFSSPNAMVNTKALDWIRSQISFISSQITSKLDPLNHLLVEDSKLVLLELYCGNGNHTVGLAPLVDHIIAVELNEKLCRLAHDNVMRNTICPDTHIRHPSNVDIVFMDSHNFAQKLLKNQFYTTSDGRRYFVFCIYIWIWSIL